MPWRGDEYLHRALVFLDGGIKSLRNAVVLSLLSESHSSQRPWGREAFLASFGASTRQRMGVRPREVLHAERDKSQLSLNPLGGNLKLLCPSLLSCNTLRRSRLVSFRASSLNKVTSWDMMGLPGC